MLESIVDFGITNLHQMNTDINTDTTDKIVAQLEATKKEIEQFVQDLNLDHTTAEERYRQLKVQLRISLDEIQESLKNNPLGAESTGTKLLNVLFELRERLDKPESSTVNEIDQLIKGVKKSLRSLAGAILTDASFNDAFEKVRDQLQRYKFKLEIIKLKLALGTLKAKYAGKEIQYRLNLKIQGLAKFIRESQHSVEDKLTKVRQMSNHIYAAFRKIYS